MNRQDILTLVRKLLGLTEERGATEYEAAAALAKARLLLTKFNLDLSSLELPATTIEHQVTGATNAKWQQALITGVAKHLYCTTLYEYGKTWIVGRDENRRGAISLFHWTKDQINLLMRAATSKFTVVPSGWRPSYCLGAVLRILDRLKVYPAPEHSTALAVTTDKENRKYVMRTFPGMQDSLIAIGSPDSGRVEGWQDGARVDLTVPVLRGLGRGQLALA